MMNFQKIIFTVFSLTAVLLSCDRGADVEDTISLDPAMISACAALASYDINLSSNTAWVAELRGYDGSDVSWISLDKSKGTGDAEITVRVFENKYSDSRKADIVFTSKGGKEAVVEVCQAGKAGGADMNKVNLRLGSYNLRMSTLDKDDAVNNWAVRSPRLLQSILDNAFDVFGVQEVDLTTQTWLKSKVGTKYNCLFFSPYSQAGVGDRAQGILYRKDAFNAEEHRYFWASSTPETCTVNDTGSSGNFSRGGSCVILTHKETGLKLFFMNTHACLNRDVNDNVAPVYEQMEKKFNPDGLPSFFVGDMNSRPEYQATAVFRTYWKDSFETADSRSGASLSYNGFTATSGKYRLDYLFYRGSGIVVSKFCINNQLYDNKFPSDHFPIWADVTITK